MSDRELKVFILGKILVDLLGEKEAIADLELLYERHPEMFRDREEVAEVIERVINEPEIVMKNPQNKRDDEILVAKMLDERKMGDVII
ncbi:hypothetical protein CCY99_03445 [Helicobacter sp. 16-1353]|uniref:hypothetical protein n=1 Tax=Helicobacter sp. 16-1353 TaxID=2004996 RepID=UPI000DCDBC4F|nr:hypothetical protein [Helicobacter sp. 16-1353]RAX54420.1 hypothetical protein CCY99_03445 [Helicobacter sp. 16-1353]